jgi:hypothetical protein
MTRTSTGANRTPILGEFSMYTPKHIAEAMAELARKINWILDAAIQGSQA